MFSTFTSSLAGDASALFPAGCCGWQLPKLAGEGQVRPGSAIMISVLKHMQDLWGSQRILGGGVVYRWLRPALSGGSKNKGWRIIVHFLICTMISCL